MHWVWVPVKATLSQDNNINNTIPLSQHTNIHMNTMEFYIEYFLIFSTNLPNYLSIYDTFHTWVKNILICLIEKEKVED